MKPTTIFYLLFRAGVCCAPGLALLACASVSESVKDLALKMADPPVIQPPPPEMAKNPGVRRMFEFVQGRIRFPQGIVSIQDVNPRTFREMSPHLIETRHALERALAVLPETSQIVIIGHSDPIGGPDEALRFGEARARSVRNYLVAHGLPRGRLTTMSAGASELLNKADVEAPENRRITFSLSEK